MMKKDRVSPTTKGGSMFYRLVSVFALLFSAQLLFAAPELTGTPQELTSYLQEIPSTVSISGTAEKKLPANLAIIHLKVTTEEKSMAEALRKNHLLRQEIASNLVAAGLPEKSIEAAQFSSTPESGFFTDKIKRYKVENRLKVSVTNETEFRVVAKLIDTLDEVSYEQTEFKLADRKAAERLLLAKACQDVSSKKMVYETELQVKLMPIRFHEGRVILNKPQRRMARAVKTLSFSEGIGDVVSPPVQFDEIELNASITVEYRLIPQ
jgi:uncharacterized protein YggE